MLFDAGDAGRTHATMKRRAELAALRASSSAAPVVTAESVVMHALVDHFQMVVDTLPQSAFVLPAVSTRGVVDAMGAFGQVAREAPRFDSDVMDDDNAEQEQPQQNAPEQLTFFKVVKSRPSNWHIVPMSRAAGSKLKASDVVISMHTGHKQDDGIVSPVITKGLGNVFVGILVLLTVHQT